MTKRSLKVALLMLITLGACNRETSPQGQGHAHDHQEEAALAEVPLHHSEGEDHAHEHPTSGGPLAPHVHGSLHLALAVDGTTIALEIHAPAQSFIGFEKTPETNEEKQIWTQFESNWNAAPEMFFRPDSSLGCTPNAPKVKLEVEAGHGEILAERTYNCQKSPAGTFFEVRFQESFLEVQKIEFEVLPDGRASYVKHVDFKTSERAPIKLAL